jgi:hypothetical protein
MDNKWRTRRCDTCRGFGVVSDYGYFGLDFYGAKDCPTCGGSGAIWLRPSGHAFRWPGGPALGMYFGYENATPVLSWWDGKSC